MKHIPEHLQTLVGQAVKRIDTPALVIDLDAMDRNIERMARFAQQHGVLWRPHAKLHKSAHIAHLLEHAGACGHCVQKVSEAEALAQGGITNIFISNEVIALPKLARVATLAKALKAQGGRLALAVDCEEGITRLARALQDAQAGDSAMDVLVEITVGQNRCGAEPGEDPAQGVRRELAEEAGLIATSKDGRVRSCAIVPEAMVGPSGTRGIQIHGSPGARRTIGLIWRSDRELSPAAERLRSVIVASPATD